MIGKKWMLALSCAALLAAPAAGFAFGHTTVVADPRLGDRSLILMGCGKLICKIM
ncbi:MAG: hypothetical protein ACLVLA_00775 [Acidaminococcus intestini]